MRYCASLCNHYRVGEAPRGRCAGEAKEVQAHDTRCGVVEGVFETLVLRQYCRCRYHDLLRKERRIH